MSVAVPAASAVRSTSSSRAVLGHEGGHGDVGVDVAAAATDPPDDVGEHRGGALFLTNPVAAASGPIQCNPVELRGKANRHTQKAVDYQILLSRELLKQNPDKKKVAHYDKMVKAHKKKADEYHAKADRCLEADNR
jgi:hypothetical protein